MMLGSPIKGTDKGDETSVEERPEMGLVRR